MTKDSENNGATKLGDTVQFSGRFEGDRLVGYDVANVDLGVTCLLDGPGFDATESQKRKLNWRHPKQGLDAFSYTDKEIVGSMAAAGRDSAVQMSQWLATTLDKAVQALLDAGLPLECLWLEHEGTETRIMMVPDGQNSDADLRTMLARVWQDATVSVDLAHNPADRSNRIMAETVCYLTMHYEGPDIGAVDFPVPLPRSPALTDNKELARRMVAETAAMSPFGASKAAAPRRSPRCQRCNAINSHGATRCYSCGGKRLQ